MLVGERVGVREEGVKKKSYGPVRIRVGGFKPQSATKIFRKEKKMQNVLKRKNMYFDEKFAKYVHLDLFYVLDYTVSFDKHIEK